jgi:glycosyltransferase involved in cell wall biosynthesis
MRSEINLTRLQMDLKISILLPIKDYDLESFIRCLNSILNQSYQNFEVIIKANCDDQSFDLLKQYFNFDKRLVFVNKKDSSVTEAANQAALISTGDIVSLFAHDDYYLDGSFESIIKNIDDSKWYFGKINYYSDNKLCRTYYLENPDISQMRYSNLIPQPACFWKRELFDEVGVFDESFKLCWDYDYWIRIMKKYKPKYVNHTIANYYLNNNSIAIKYPELMEQENKMIVVIDFIC